MHGSRTRRPLLAVSALIATTALALAGCSSSGSNGGGGSGDKKVTLTLHIGNVQSDRDTAKAIISAFEKKNPNITIKTDPSPTGTEGDNLVKTQLSTGSMDDILEYNSGSLFQQINPKKNLVPVTDESWVKNLNKDFKNSVSADKDVYGAPWGTASTGAILYNTKVYKQLGLEIPKTWDDFIANSEKVKAAGKTAVIETFGTTWTSQLLVLGDFYNVSAAEPDWAEKYTKNKANYADDPVARAGFDHIAEVYDKKLMNSDFASAQLGEGLKMLATGEGVQFPMLSSQLPGLEQNYPDQVNDIGVFPIPGKSADKNGLTMWMPNGLYIPNTTKGDKLAAAKKFLAFVASPAGCEAQTNGVGVLGSYMVKGCTLPDKVPTMVKDMQKYVSDGNTGLALEFLSPVKGPNLETILIAVGSGITPPKKGAEQYDADVKKQAQQLNLPGWS